MGIDTQGRQAVTYFVGTEVEHTRMLGQKTLFVVGVRPNLEILEQATYFNINHIYLGTSQSFTPETLEDWMKWVEMIDRLLNQQFVVTLDFDVKYATDMMSYEFISHENFIPMISVKLPYINRWNKDATLKIDDTTWGATNSGVWCHSLNELKADRVYSDWSVYKGDTPVNEGQ